MYDHIKQELKQGYIEYSTEKDNYTIEIAKDDFADLTLIVDKTKQI